MSRLLHLAAAALLALALPAPPEAVAHASELAKKGPSKRRAAPRSNEPQKSPARPTASTPARAPRGPIAPVTPPVAPSLNLSLQRTTLRNGMRVVLAPDASLPAVSIALSFAAGPASEQQGQEGLSQILHAAMQGPTVRLPAGDVARRVHALSGLSQSHLTEDIATYTTTLPPGALRLGLWLEAERMHNLAPDEAWLRSYLQARRPVDPLDAARDKVASLAFQGCWPYAHPQATEPGQPASVLLKDLDAFRGQVHNPANAVIVVVGSFDPVQATAWISELFRRADGHPTPLTPSITLPAQINQRNHVTVAQQAPRTWFLYGWAVPDASNEEYLALQLALPMLATDRHDESDSPPRLQRLVPEAQVHVELDERRGPSLLTLRVEIRGDSDLEHTRRKVLAALEELAAQGPTEQEMLAAWHDAEIILLRRLESPAERARMLASEELMHGDASKLETSLQRLFAINREQVRRAVELHLRPIRRNRVELRRPAIPRAPETARPELSPEHGPRSTRAPSSTPGDPGQRPRKKTAKKRGAR